MSVVSCRLKPDRHPPADTRPPLFFLVLPPPPALESRRFSSPYNPPETLPGAPARAARPGGRLLGPRLTFKGEFPGESMRSKTFLTILGGAALCLAAAGCNPDNNTNTANANRAANANAVDAPVATATPAGSAYNRNYNSKEEYEK